MKLLTAFQVMTDVFLSKICPPRYAWQDGFKFLTSDRSMIRHINRGLSEPYTGDIDIIHRYLRQYPKKNRACVDVGAHIGTTILPYSRLFHSTYGYEPNTGLFLFLKHNIFTNNIKNVTVKNKAVLNRKFKGNIKRHSITTSGCYFFEEDESGDIEAVSLDNEQLKNVDFLKVDTEGSEFLVLKGAEKLIKKYKPLIMMEINGMSEKNFGIASERIFELMNGLGYLEYDRCGHNVYFWHSSTTNWATAAI
ncbi:FkbM family methyltransferase [Amylibacter sp.]|jgi:FkbM family methyltransferase|nr:FkbM family methyltransferase [Amylibacter sp.]